MTVLQVFFGNLIFALTAGTLSGNHLNIPQLFSMSVREQDTQHVEESHHDLNSYFMTLVASPAGIQPPLSNLPSHPAV